MTWQSDSCDCEFICVSGNVGFISTVKRCKLPAHINAIGSTHLTVVIAHNTSFNLKDGRNPTKQQVEQQAIDKAVEKARISQL